MAPCAHRYIDARGVRLDGPDLDLLDDSLHVLDLDRSLWLRRRCCISVAAYSTQRLTSWSLDQLEAIRRQQELVQPLDVVGRAAVRLDARSTRS